MSKMKLTTGKNKVKTKKCDEFLTTLDSIFRKASYFGISRYEFTVSFCLSCILFVMLFALEACAILKIISILAGWSTNAFSGSMVDRLSGSIFYGNAIFSLVLSSKFVHSWRDLSSLWLSIETSAGLTVPPDIRIRKRMIFVTSLVVICAIVEHMLYMMSATGFDCPPEEYFQRFILSSHGLVLHPGNYSLWVAIPIFILNKLATALWNFQDLIIILISMGLTSRYHRLNLNVYHVIKNEKRFRGCKKFEIDLYHRIERWRRLREAFVRHAALVRSIDKKLGPLMLLCNINNLYFICLQLFLGIHKDKSSAINRAYYLLSLSWLLFKASGILLAAADVHLHSQRALKFLYSCPSAGYNVEIKRLQYQLTHDFVALSGMGLFTLRRRLLLDACAILKIISILAGWSTNAFSGSMVDRLSGSIFYGNALFSLVLSSKFVHSWRDLSSLWLSIETTAGLTVPPDIRIRKRMIFVTSLVVICAIVEHMLYMMSATGFDSPPEEYFQRFILSSHGLVLHPGNYSLWVAIPIFILNKLATALWNFQDLIIILISMGLTSRYHRLNLNVYHVIKNEKRFRGCKKFEIDLYHRIERWRRLREAFVRHAALVRSIDKKLGPLMLLCNINNLYFICLQLFLGIHKDKSSAINRAYYLLSLSWLLFKASGILLAAADVHLHSQRALKFLYSCPSAGYNVEVKRLQYQLTHDFVALSGMGLFTLRRRLLLDVAAAIIKYELLLIQNNM